MSIFYAFPKDLSTIKHNIENSGAIRRLDNHYEKSNLNPPHVGERGNFTLEQPWRQDLTSQQDDKASEQNKYIIALASTHGA